MKCPKCGDEFQQGFTVCTGCGAELVEELSNEPPRPTRWWLRLLLFQFVALILFGIGFSFSKDQQRSIRSRRPLALGFDQEITFASPETEEYVRKYSPFAAEGKTSLHLGSEESSTVSNLSHIATMVNLTSLGMRVSPDCDLRPLSMLTNLVTLGLNKSEIHDLTPVSTLTHLKTLHLLGSAVEDLTPLAELEDLATLDLTGTKIADTASLGAMTNVTSLIVDCANVSHLHLLATGHRLTHVELSCSSLADLGLLRLLLLGGNEIEDVSAIAELPQLGHGTDSVEHLINGKIWSPTIVFQSVSAQWAAGFSYPTEAGKTYRIQYTPDIMSTNWFDLPQTMEGNGAVMYMYDPLGFSPRRNYRVVELP